MENLDILVKELCKQPNESGWVEFKVHPTFGVMRQSCSAYSLS